MKLQASAQRKILVLGLVLAASVTAEVRSQNAEIFFESENEGVIGIVPGAFAVFEMYGPASVPCALRIGFQGAAIPTIYGELGLMPGDPEGFFVLNGYDPGHAFHAASHISAAGNLNLIFQPFTNINQAPGYRFYAQAYVTDPTSPVGATLTNTLEVESATIPPRFDHLEMNFAAHGGNLLIHGDGFGFLTGSTVVTLDGEPCTLLSAQPDSLFVQTPAQGRSGPIGITTAGGSCAGDPNDVEQWCALISNVFLEGAEPGIATTHTTVLGSLLAPGETDSYQLQVSAGQEIFAELYAWNHETQRITSASDPVNSSFDLIVRLRRGTFPLVEDDDSGPHLNAGIGLTTGESFFVADQSDVYTIEVDTALSSGVGNYLLIYGARTPTVLPVTIAALYPNVARAGDTVTAHVTGEIASSPSAHSITVGGFPAAIMAVNAGTIQFVVPLGAISATVVLTTPLGASSPNYDRMASWLCVVDPANQIEVEGTTTTVTVDATIFGSINTIGDTDRIRFPAIAGRSYRIEAYAFNPTVGRIVTAEFLSSEPLDPEIRVVAADTMFPYLATDGNGGPGFNSLIGNTIESSPFIAPATTNYDVVIVGWLSFSIGDYVIRIVDVTH